VQSVAPNYSSALNLRDVYLVNGDTGLLIGDYLQGVHVHNLNTVNTKNALKVIPTVGGQGLEEIHISDSYLHGQVTFGNASFPTVLFAVFVTGTYFDSIGGVIPANGAHVSIIGTSQIVFSNNIFNGPSTATANVTGLKLTTGAGAFEQLFTGNLFQAYLAGGVAIALDSTTKNIMFVGTSFLNNTTAVTDAGTNNQFSATSNNYVPFIWGSGSVAPTGQAFVDGLINFRGNVNVAGALFATDPNGSVGLGSTAAAGTPYIDFRSSGHSGHDAQIIASGGTGALDGTLAVNAAQLMAPATHANGGIHLGANVGANPQDIIKHVELYEGAGYGFGVTAAQLNYNVPAAAIHHFYVGTTHVAQIGPAGISTGVLGGPAWSSGTGAPAATAQIGSLYSRVDGAVGSTLYVSRGGGTWAAVAGV
jgi:hypothetical protein